MAKRMLSLLSQEEFLVPVIIFTALLIAFSPFLYELSMTARYLPESRYPLFEADFAPDQRVYLSRMMEGYQGEWLVKEKFTSELHKPSLLHVSYLLMGKITGILGITPIHAFPIWKLICGAFLLISGYFFILNFLPKRRLRLAAFLLFVFVGNFPLLAKQGIPFLGRHFTTVLSWYTFFDPVRRLVFLPHYNLSSALLILALVFFNRGIKQPGVNEFFKAGLFVFLAGVVLPHTLLVAILTAGLLTLIHLLGRLKSRRVMVEARQLIIKQVPFWFATGVSLLLFQFSISSFPWNLPLAVDLSKREELAPFRYSEFILGLGTTGVIGLLGSFYILFRQKRNGYASALWFLSTLLLSFILMILPISHPARLTQIDLHLPIAVSSVILISDVSYLIKKRQKLVFSLLVLFTLLPSFLLWPISLKGQKMFVDAKISAGYPLIPQKPYVVYPIRTVMEAIFWLRDNTHPDEVVLAAETIGNMVPAYAGNTVYLGHGSQTVNFDEKIVQMERFYQGVMSEVQTRYFLNESGIKFIFFGPEEKNIGSAFLKLEGSLFVKVYNNEDIIICKVM